VDESRSLRELIDAGLIEKQQDEWGRAVYDRLLRDGVDDFSVSLDACCSSFADVMAGCECGFDRVCDNIRFLAARTYTTVGVVVNAQNEKEVQRIVEVADSLGVADICVIPAAQYSKMLATVKLSDARNDAAGQGEKLRYSSRSGGCLGGKVEECWCVFANEGQQRESRRIW